MDHTNNIYNLHPAQLELYYDQIIDLESPHYNVGGYVFLEGALDKEKLLLAVRHIQEVYDIHRLSFNFEGDEPTCVFKDHHFDITVKEVDLSEEEDPRAAAETWMRNGYNIAFSLQEEPLYEYALLHLGPQQHILYCKYLHILNDGYGFTLTVQSIAQKYTDLVNGISEDTAEYKQYREEIVKANEYLSSEKYQEDAAYWLEQFKEIPSPILANKYQEEGANQSRTLIYEISEERRAKYNELNKRLGTSLQHLTLAAFHIYFGKLMPEDSSTFGVFVHKRRKVQREMLGMFAGIIPYKAEYDSSLTIKELVRKIKRQLINNYRHQNYPVGHLNRELKLMKDGQAQLFEIIVNYLHLDFDFDFGGLKSTTCDLLSDYEKSPLRLWWRDYGERQALQLRVDLSLSYIKVAEVELIIDRVLNLLDKLGDCLDLPLSDINILSEKEEQQLLYDFNDTEKSYPTDKTVVDLFEEQVAKTPDKVAIVYEDQSLTFKELDEQSNQLGHYLIKKGIEVETSIAICLDRSLYMMLGLTGIIKAGAAYVPIEPGYPQDRIDYILDNSQAKFVICTKEYAHNFEGKNDLQVLVIDEAWAAISREPITKPAVDLSPENLMYVIYTSGSTGKPKGVMNQYSGVVNYLSWLQDHYQLQPKDDVILQLTTYCFDVSVWELFWPLIAGIKLVFARPGGQKDNDYLKVAIEQYQITTIHFVPSMLEVFLQGVEDGECASIRKVICSGETLTPSHVAEFRKHLPHAQLINLYGPTEAAVDVTFWDVPPIDVPVDKVPIGKPLANTQLYVVSQKGQLCPVGVQGELYVGGIQVARGYINREELTADRFIEDRFRPESGTKLYKTGDLALWLPDGNVEFLGRIDNQVKIRGNRVELGEIEAVIQEVEGVNQCVVLAQPDPTGKLRLVAYVVVTGVFDKAFIQECLKAKLPEYMVPSIMMELDEIPLMASGKANTKVLPNPDASMLVSSEYVAPQKEIEEQLVTVWKDLLKVDQVGIYDNFFELGGDSIITIQLVRQLKELGYELSPKDVFVNARIADLATVIEQNSKGIVVEQETLTGQSDLSAIQEWFFEKENGAMNHFNQSVLLEIDKKVEIAKLEESIKWIVAHHDALRFTYKKDTNKWNQAYGSEVGKVEVVDLSEIAKEKEAEAITEICDQYQAALNIETGELLKVILIKTAGEKNRLFITVHHLVIDGVSWRILLSHLSDAIQATQKGEPIQLGLKTSSYRDWMEAIKAYALTKEVTDQQDYWEEVVSERTTIPVDKESDDTSRKEVKKYVVSLDEKYTDHLLKDVNQSYNTKIDDLLLGTLGKTLGHWSGNEKLSLFLEGNGRENISDEIDLTNTIGWFSSLYPMNLLVEQDSKSSDLIKSVKEQLRMVPANGLAYGLLRYLHPSPEVRKRLTIEKEDVMFNYLGQIDNIAFENDLLDFAAESTGKNISDDFVFDSKLIVDSYVSGGKLYFNWSYSSAEYESKTIERIAWEYIENLVGLISHCISKEEVEYTPSDYGLTNIVDFKELDEFLNTPENGLLRKYTVKDLYQLSPLQEGMLFHGLYDPASSLYTEQYGFDFPEGVNVEAFKASWQYIIEKNDILRTSFFSDHLSVPVQVVQENVAFSIRELDYSSFSKEVAEAKLEAFTSEDFNQGFDFEVSPLMRITLIKLSGQKYRMLWTFHHILLDGWSASVVMSELLTTYHDYMKGIAPAEGAINNYGDYIKHLGKVDKYKEERFWKKYLAGFDTPTLLPFVDNKLDRNKGGETTKELNLIIDQDLTEKLNAYAKANRLTVNTLMQGVWSYLLSQYTGSKDTVFGVTVSGRPTTLGNMDEGVGLYINTLALRSQFQENQKITNWLADVQKGHTEAREYQYATLNKVQKAIGINNDFFDSILVFENYPMGELLTKDWSLKVDNIEIKEQTNYLLTIVVTLGTELAINFSYNNALLNGEYVEMIRAHFETVIREIVEAKKEVVTEIEMLTTGEKTSLDNFNDTAAAYPIGHTFVELFEAQVASHNRDVALVFEEEKITYGELNERANRLANYLVGKGVGEESFVLLCLDRSVEMVVSLLAVMKAGGAYIPIDPLFPADRIRHIIKDAKAANVISTRNYEAIFEGTEEIDIVYLKEEWQRIMEESTAKPEVICQSENLAYTIYTSGSTGLPKGVMIEQGALLNFLCSMVQTLGADANSSLLAVTTYSFDIAYLELYMPMLVGGQVILASSEAAADGTVLQELIARHQPTYLQATPATWKMLLNNGWENKEKVVVMSGGEAIKEELKNDLTDLSDQKVWNLYGPTETTIWSTVQELKREERVNIGGPIANTHIYIVSNEEEITANSLVPVGVIGELCIGGDGLARGYINRPDLNAEKFIANPFSEEEEARIYRTGDLARWLPDGNIECLGRKDHQVKIRGYRIELGEIETIIQQCATVNQCVVHAKEDAKGNKRLVAYIIPSEGYDKKEIRSYLKSKLPDYMVPAIFMELEVFPLTPNGKINRIALPEPDVTLLVSNIYVAPRNKNEEVLVDIWKKILGVEKVGIYDDFFELGGHSLFATRVSSAIKKNLQIAIPVNVLFRFTCIADLSEYIDVMTVIDRSEKRKDVQMIEI